MLAIIIVLLLLVIQKHLFYSKLINGIWISTREFNERSQLSNMVLLIEGGTFKKRMFVTMFVDGNSEFSQIYDLHMLPSVDPRPGTQKTLCYCNADIFRKMMWLEITTDGILTLQWGNTIYYEGIKM